MIRLLRNFFIAVLVAISVPVATASSEILIRDAEIESFLDSLMEPFLAYTKTEPEVFITQSTDFNAFVYGGQSMFVTTGLIYEVDGPYELASVLAHELGHIAAGHVILGKQYVQNLSGLAFLSGLAAFGVALSGQPEAAQGGLVIAHDILQKSAFKFSREHEFSADRIMVVLMQEAGYPLNAAVEVMHKLREKEAMFLPEDVDPYLLTHPLSNERVKAIRNSIGNLPHAAENRQVESLFALVRAKAFAFTVPLRQIKRRYASDGGDLAHRYARAIYHYRRDDLQKALALIDSLIVERPAYPYFHELKGQMLYEHGRFPAAAESLQTALDLAPRQALIRLLLAKVQFESDQEDLLEVSAFNLRTVVEQEPKNGFAWQELGKVETQRGRKGHAMLAFAEAAFLWGDLDQARWRVAEAEKQLPAHSSEWQKAQDLRLQLGQREAGR